MSGDGNRCLFYFTLQGGVSRVQERQMVTQKGANTHVFAIRGNFVDAQAALRIFLMMTTLPPNGSSGSETFLGQFY